MIMKNLTIGQTVYFINDMREFGGKKTIQSHTVASIYGEWCELSNGSYHKIDHMTIDKSILSF